MCFSFSFLFYFVFYEGVGPVLSLQKFRSGLGRLGHQACSRMFPTFPPPPSALTRSWPLLAVSLICFAAAYESSLAGENPILIFFNFLSSLPFPFSALFDRWENLRNHNFEWDFIFSFPGYPNAKWIDKNLNSDLLSALGKIFRLNLQLHSFGCELIFMFNNSMQSRNLKWYHRNQVTMIDHLARIVNRKGSFVFSFMGSVFRACPMAICIYMPLMDLKHR